MNRDLEYIYISINIININDIPQHLQDEVNATNFFCKRILSLTRILKLENIKIELIKKLRLIHTIKKYMEIDKTNFYFIEGDNELYRLECPYSVLLEALDEIETY